MYRVTTAIGRKRGRVPQCIDNDAFLFFSRDTVQTYTWNTSQKRGHADSRKHGRIKCIVFVRGPGIQSHLNHKQILMQSYRHGDLLSSQWADLGVRLCYFSFWVAYICIPICSMNEFYTAMREIRIRIAELTQIWDSGLQCGKTRKQSERGNSTRRLSKSESKRRNITK